MFLDFKSSLEFKADTQYVSSNISRGVLFAVLIGSVLRGKLSSDPITSVLYFIIHSTFLFEPEPIQFNFYRFESDFGF